MWGASGAHLLVEALLDELDLAQGVGVDGGHEVREPEHRRLQLLAHLLHHQHRPIRQAERRRGAQTVRSDKCKCASQSNVAAWSNEIRRSYIDNEFAVALEALVATLLGVCLSFWTPRCGLHVWTPRCAKNQP